MDLSGCLETMKVPNFVLKKPHNALSYHFVREAIAANIMHFLHLDGH